MASIGGMLAEPWHQRDTPGLSVARLPFPPADFTWPLLPWQGRKARREPRITRIARIREETTLRPTRHAPLSYVCLSYPCYPCYPWLILFLAGVISSKRAPCFGRGHARSLDAAGHLVDVPIPCGAVVAEP